MENTGKPAQRLQAQGKRRVQAEVDVDDLRVRLACCRAGVLAEPCRQRRAGVRDNRDRRRRVGRGTDDQRIALDAGGVEGAQQVAQVSVQPSGLVGKPAHAEVEAPRHRATAHVKPLAVRHAKQHRR